MYKVGDRVMIVRDQSGTLIGRSAEGEVVRITKVRVDSLWHYDIRIWSDKISQEIDWPISKQEIAPYESKIRKAKEKITGEIV